MDVEKTLGALSLAGLMGLQLALTVGLTACGQTMKSSANSAAVSDQCAPSAIPNRFLVQWKDGTTSVEEAEDESAFQKKVLGPNQDKIIFAEHDFKVTIEHPLAAHTTGNMAGQMAGQMGYSADAATPMLSPSLQVASTWGQTDVDAADAWSLATGAGVIVAVVDAGADVTHPQLQNQIAVNSADKPANGIDDEGNGFVDDTYGYDFAANSGSIHDGTEGHGTHVSGIILAQHGVSANGVTGINGMAPNAQLLPLNFMASDGTGDISVALQAIDYAVKRKAKVINASWGGGCASSLQTKIASLAANGVLFVTAAGNGGNNGVGLNLDVSPSYPAAFSIPGQITVGAVMQTEINGAPADVMTGFSNYSTTLVHLMAPGEDIRSTFPASGSICSNGENDGYCEMSGTSMATPFVSGVAALLFSYRPKATVAQVKAAILAGVTPGNFLTLSGGRLNAKKALDALAQAVSQ